MDTTVLSYIGLAYCAWVFTVFTWNRCIAIGGAECDEPNTMGVYMAIALPVFVWCMKTLF